jgi:hypothetical protein
MARFLARKSKQSPCISLIRIVECGRTVGLEKSGMRLRRGILKNAFLVAVAIVQLLGMGQLHAHVPNVDEECAQRLVQARKSIFISIIQGITTLPQMQFGGAILGAQAVLDSIESVPLPLLADHYSKWLSIHPEMLRDFASAMNTSHRKLGIPHLFRPAASEQGQFARVSSLRLNELASGFIADAFVHVYYLTCLATEGQFNIETWAHNDAEIIENSLIPSFQSMSPEAKARFDEFVRANRVLVEVLSLPEFLIHARKYQLALPTSDRNDCDLMASLESTVMRAFSEQLDLYAPKELHADARSILNLFFLE